MKTILRSIARLGFAVLTAGASSCSSVPDPASPSPELASSQDAAAVGDVDTNKVPGNGDVGAAGPCIDWYMAHSGRYITTTGTCPNPFDMEPAPSRWVPDGAIGVPRATGSNGGGSGGSGRGDDGEYTEGASEEGIGDVGDYRRLCRMLYAPGVILNVNIEITKATHKIENIMVFSNGLPDGVLELEQLGEGVLNKYDPTENSYSFEVLFRFKNAASNAKAELLVGKLNATTGKYTLRLTKPKE